MSFFTSSSGLEHAVAVSSYGLTLALQQLLPLSTLRPDLLHLEDFISIWRAHAGKPLLCAPVYSIEALDVVDRKNALRRQTMGLYGHRFIIITARVSSPNQFHEPVYIPVDNVAVSNCLSFTEQIMFVAGRGYADHWRSGVSGIFPHPLRDYIDGKLDEVDAGIAVAVPEGLLRRVAQVGTRAWKGGLSFVTSPLPREKRVRRPGDVVSEILEVWGPRKPEGV